MKLVLLLLLLVFPFGEILRFDIAKGTAIRLSDIILGFFLLWFLIRLRTDGNIFKKLYLFKPLSFFIVCASFSLLLNSFNYTSEEVVISSFYLLRWVAYSSLYIFIANYVFSKTKKFIVNILVAFLGFTILFGYVQYFFYPDLRNLYYLGWDEHLYRMFSTFLDPNFFSVVVNFYLFIVLIRFFLCNEKREKRLLVLLFLVGFISLLLTYSRAGYIMFATGAITLLILLNKKSMIILLSILLIIGVIILPKDLRSAGVELWRTDSINSRIISAQRALLIFKSSPLFGIGFNTYRYAQRDLGYVSYKDIHDSHSTGTTENSFLFILATTGIVGFIAYVYLLYKSITIAYTIYKTSKKDENKLALSILSISFLSGLIMNSFFINSLFYPAIMVLIWTTQGLLENDISLKKEGREKR